MDENVNSLSQAEISFPPTDPNLEVPRFWEAAKLFFRGLLYFFILSILFFIFDHFIHLPKIIFIISFDVCLLYIHILVFKWVINLNYSLEKTFRLFTLPKNNYIPILFIAISLCLFKSAISYFLIKIGLNSPLPNLSLPNEWWNLIIRINSAIILAPILEELICRGILLSSISKSINTIWAIIISSILFGIAHIYTVNIIVISLSAILTAWIVIKTNSILSGIIIHFVNNSIAESFYLLKNNGDLKYFQNLDLTVKWGISIFVFISSIIMLILGIKWLLRNFDLSSQRPITFISDYFRRKNESNQVLLKPSETLN